MSLNLTQAGFILRGAGFGQGQGDVAVLPENYDPSRLKVIYTIAAHTVSGHLRCDWARDINSAGDCKTDLALSWARNTFGIYRRAAQLGRFESNKECFLGICPMSLWRFSSPSATSNRKPPEKSRFRSLADGMNVDQRTYSNPRFHSTSLQRE